MPTGQNADGLNADRMQLHVLERNDDSRCEHESDQTKRVTLKVKDKI